MWELDSKESWTPKNWCFWTVVLEKTRESPLDCKEIQPVHSKGDQCWVFFGRTDAKAETPVLGHLMRRVDSLEKTLMLGGIGGRRRRGRQRMRWLDVITDSMDMSLSNSGSWWWTRRPYLLRFMGPQRVGHDWATELNLTEVGHSFSSKEQASLNFMAAVTISSDFRVQENKICHCFHCFPIYLPWNDGTKCYDLSFLNIEL